VAPADVLAITKMSICPALDRVVKVTVLLARPDLYREMNEAYAEFFPGAKPARAMVRFGADIPGVLVAIEAIALA
jgi:2-iminobutanoate/2-iminopropanoate deaminase